MRKTAFTIIELLIVILLIMLLLTLLVPGLAAARRYAIRTKCQTQLNDIGKGFHAYFTAYQQWPRRASTVGYPNEWDDAWKDQVLNQFIKDPRIFYCPDNNASMTPPATWDSAKTKQLSYVVLDGQPGPTDPMDPGPTGGKYVWSSKSNRPTYNGSTWVDTLVYERPYLGSRWASVNGPIVGDINMVRKNGSQIVNHGVSGSTDPIGQNILYFDGSVHWIVPEDATPDVDDLKRRWRTIWERTDTKEKIRFIWAPSEVAPEANK
ncbi:MAG: hypothetical protein BIFFINMI_02532 [Phycisphaerae bacterium]|nr:hypothetical protein [Phycisphaerae bacterium]